MALPLPLLPLEARTGSGASPHVDALGHGLAELVLVLGPAAPGTTVAVQVESSDEGQIWFPAGTPVSLETSAAGGRTEIFRTDLSRFVRASWSVAPSGQSALFSLAGQATQVLANRDDINTMGWVPHGLEAYSDDEVAKALATGSETAVGYLNKAPGIVPPLTAWGRDVRWAVVQLAVYDLYAAKGTLDPVTVDRARQALDWLKAVAKGNISSPGLVGSSPPAGPDDPDVDAAWAYSEPDRGWGGRRGRYR